MSSKRTWALVGLWGVAIIGCIPYLIIGAFQSLTGFGFKKKFESGGRTIVRPDHFNTRGHKAAFEDIGNYVTNFLTRDVMIVYQDSSLSDKNSLHPKGISLSVWHEVLHFFVGEGVIVERWELRIPMSLKQPSYYSKTSEAWDPYREGWLRTPLHGPNGEELEPAKDNWISGQIPDSTSFNPGLLTPEQKEGLIGLSYKIYANWMTFYGDEDLNAEIVIQERNFRRLFYRRRELISEEAKQRGVEKLAAAIAMSAATRK